MNQQMREQSPRSSGVELPPRVSTRTLGRGGQSRDYYNRTAYAPNYTEIDSGPYEMEHMSHVISNEGARDLPVIPNDEIYEVVPDEMIPQLPDVQPSLLGYTNPGYIGSVPTQPKGQTRCNEKCRCMWFLVFLQLSVTAVLLLVVFGGKKNHK